jgi:two-component system sensor histidine kinase BaeS
MGAEEFRIDLADVDVTKLVKAAGEVWLTRCRAADVVFRVEAPSGPLWCHTDSSRVRQILDGLFENALRVTPPGEPIILSVRAEAELRTVLLEVRDGGPGLTDADLAVAFERSALYERYRGIRQVGTGLGLAIVEGLSRRLGGTVEAGHSAEGGARFTVRLPAGGPAGG